MSWLLAQVTESQHDGVGGNGVVWMQSEEPTGSAHSNPYMVDDTVVKDMA